MRFPTSGTLVALALAALAAGCDFHGDPFLVHPEFDDVTSFEADLGEWIPRALYLGPPASWEIARSAERATEGTQSARLRLANSPGQEGRIFLERRYDVEREQLYDVDIAFDFASADSGAVTPWQLIVGADVESPMTSGITVARGDTGSGGTSEQGFVFVPKTLSVEVTTDEEEGELFVYVGVQATSASERTYFIDNLKVTLTRKGITTARP